MTAFGQFVSWLTANAEVISIIVAILLALVPAVWTYIRYLGLKSKELQHERFKIYHGLIRELVQPDPPGQAMAMDRQIAVVFELRHFPEYFELTLRLLEGLRDTWVNHGFDRLTQEINSTIDFIAERSKHKPLKQTPRIAPPAAQ
jgi:hypothetical protein